MSITQSVILSDELMRGVEGSLFSHNFFAAFGSKSGAKLPPRYAYPARQAGQGVSGGYSEGNPL